MTSKTEETKPTYADMGLGERMMRLSATFHGVEKGSEGHRGNKYTHIDDLWLALRQPLLEHGLAATFSTDMCGDEWILMLQVTMLEVPDSPSYTTSMPLHLQGKDAQQIGSLLTYYRRYLLVTAFNITGAVVDDDGIAASAPPTLTEEQQADLVAKADELFGEDGPEKIKGMCELLLNVKKPSEIQQSDFGRALKALETRRKALDKEKTDAAQN